RERLGGRHLVHEMQIDVEDRRRVVGFGTHQVGVPDLVEERARHAVTAPGGLHSNADGDSGASRPTPRYNPERQPWRRRRPFLIPGKGSLPWSSAGISPTWSAKGSGSGSGVSLRNRSRRFPISRAIAPPSSGRPSAGRSRKGSSLFGMPAPRTSP